MLNHLHTVLQTFGTSTIFLTVFRLDLSAFAKKIQQNLVDNNKNTCFLLAIYTIVQKRLPRLSQNLYYPAYL